MKLVFRVSPDKKGELDKVLADDEISRQSITVMDHRALGMAKEGHYLFLSGNERALGRASDLLAPHGERLTGDELRKAEAALHEMEESAASGMGGMFDL